LTSYVTSYGRIGQFNRRRYHLFKLFGEPVLELLPPAPGHPLRLTNWTIAIENPSERQEFNAAVRGHLLN
jgi:hypothetical protein